MNWCLPAEWQNVEPLLLGWLGLTYVSTYIKFSDVALQPSTLPRDNYLQEYQKASLNKSLCLRAQSSDQLCSLIWETGRDPNSNLHIPPQHSTIPSVRHLNQTWKETFGDDGGGNVVIQRPVRWPWPKEYSEDVKESYCQWREKSPDHNGRKPCHG